MSAERNRHPVLSSLAAFLSAAIRPRSLLARAIVTVLAIKLVAVVGMAVYAHYADQRPSIDATAVSRLIGPSARP